MIKMARERTKAGEVVASGAFLYYVPAPALSHCETCGSELAEEQRPRVPRSVYRMPPGGKGKLEHLEGPRLSASGLAQLRHISAQRRVSMRDELFHEAIAGPEGRHVAQARQTVTARLCADGESDMPHLWRASTISANVDTGEALLASDGGMTDEEFREDWLRSQQRQGGVSEGLRRQLEAAVAARPWFTFDPGSIAGGPVSLTQVRGKLVAGGIVRRAEEVLTAAFTERRESAA